MTCTFLLKVQIGFPSSFSSPSDELSYVKAEVIFIKSISFAVCPDDLSNSAVVTVSVRLLLGLECFPGERRKAE